MSNDRVGHSFLTSTKYFLPPSRSRQKLDFRLLATDPVFNKIQCKDRESPHQMLRRPQTPHHGTGTKTALGFEGIAGHTLRYSTGTRSAYEYLLLGP